MEASSGYDMANIAYDQSDFDYVDWRVSRPVPFKIYQAGWAAIIALLEVSKDDVDPFRRLQNIAAHPQNDGTGFLLSSGAGKRTKDTPQDEIPGTEFTDILWAETGYSDTAAVAASGWSCEGLSKNPRSDKLLEFWSWWITEAIPQAVNLAENTGNGDEIYQP